MRKPEGWEGWAAAALALAAAAMYFCLRCIMNILL